MKQFYGAIFFISLAMSPILRADESTRGNYPPPPMNQSPAPYYMPPPGYFPPQPPAYAWHPVEDPGFTLLDVLIYRPIGLAVTIAGAGLTVGISPLIALASIPKPHDAFSRVFDILVNEPAAYTFVRPLGNRSLPYRYLQR